MRPHSDKRPRRRYDALQVGAKPRRSRLEIPRTMRNAMMLLKFMQGRQVYEIAQAHGLTTRAAAAIMIGHVKAYPEEIAV